MTGLRDHGHDIMRLDDDQFSKLVELLTPGYECSKLMLAELQARDADRQKWEAEREHGVSTQADAPAAPGNVDSVVEPTAPAEPKPEAGADTHDEG